MPELPEVETTRRGVEPHVVARRVVALRIHEARLRWPVAPELARRVRGAEIEAAERRAKYLLFRLDGDRTLLVHLGMSGNLRVLPSDTPRRKHDHFDLELDSGATLRFNDPRRFGSLHLIDGDPQEHPLLRTLGPEPLEPAFDAEHLWRRTRRRRVAIRQLSMDGRGVVGVGSV